MANPICPQCHTVNTKGNRFCSKCGAALPEPAPKKKRSTLLIVAGLAGLLVICVCVAVALLPGTDTGTAEATKPAAGQEKQAEPVQAAAVTAAPESTATPEPTAAPAPPYAEIEAKVESMTEVQWKAYLETLTGLAVVGWQGWVVDVDQSLGGRYDVWVDMDDPGAVLSSQDVYLKDIDEATAIALNKGQPITFSGRIKRASELLGSVTIDVEQVTIAK